MMHEIFSRVNPLLWYLFKNLVYAPYMALSKMKIIIYVNQCTPYVQHNKLIYPNQSNF